MIPKLRSATRMPLRLSSTALLAALAVPAAAQPNLQVTPTSLSYTFNAFDAPADRTMTVRNIGNAAASVSIANVQTSQPSATALAQPAPQTARIYSAAAYDAPFAEDRVIVVYREGQSSLSTAHSAATAGTTGPLRELAQARHPGTGEPANRGRRMAVARLRSRGKAAVRQAIEALRQDPNVAYVQPDYVVRALDIPNDPRFAEQYHLNNEGQTGGTPDADVDAAEGWNRAKHAGSVIVGVIDSGVDYLHPDLAAGMWRNTGETAGNGVDDDGNGYVDDVHGYDFANNDGDPMDDHFHGTHVAGTIAAAGNNGIGVSGVAWSARIMALKFLDASGNGFTSAAINAVNYARAMGAAITNNSWGGGPYDQALIDAIAASGALFVASAGNNGADTDVMPQYPAGYDLPNVLSVGASNAFEGKAWFSNYGAASVDVMAPGEAILATTPRFITSEMTAKGIPVDYGFLSGTSMAAPVVSGIAALVRQVGGAAMTPVALRNLIQATVDVLPAYSGLCATSGRVNLEKALARTSAAWLSQTPSTLNLAPGAQANVVVRASPANMPAGAYGANVVVSAPGAAARTVPVTMNVAACVTISGPGSLDFGSAWVNQAVMRGLTLTNTCNAALNITAINSSSAAFANTSALPIRVPAYGNATAQIRYRSASAGTQTATLTVVSNATNAPNFTVSAMGRSQVPPKLTLTPASLSGTAAVGASATATLTVGNTGVANLTGTLSATTADRGLWLTASPATVNVAAGSGAAVTVTMNAGGLLGGTYTGEVLLAHNDPAAPSPARVPVTFTVTGTRNLRVTPASLNFVPQQTDRSAPFVQRVVDPNFHEFRTLRLGDMDGDGDMDIVAGNEVIRSGLARVSWFENRNNHGWSFTPRPILARPIGSAKIFHHDCTPVDFDKDGDMDVLVAAAIPFSAGSILWYEKTPGGFVERVVTSNVQYVNRLKVADIDGDGDNDVASASGTDNKIAWFRNMGNGTFAEVVVSTSVMNALSVDIGDIDRDGDLDLASASYNDNSIRWFRNNGGGAFTEALVIEHIEVQHSVLEDLDKDGDLDILGSGLHGGAAWYQNNGSGAFTARSVLAGSDEVWTYHIHAADMDMDGDKDLVIANRNGDSYSTDWFENDGSQNFAVRRRIAPDIISSMASADFDGDGDLDVAMGLNVSMESLPTPSLLVLENRMATNNAYAQLHNTGTGPVTVTGLALSSNRFTTTNRAPLVVPPRDSLSVNLLYALASGSRTGTLTVTSNATDNPTLTVALNGVDAPGIALPGRLQAEDYKAGGQGVGYNDLSAGNTGGVYRTDNVDIQATTDAGGGHNVGWIQAGEWLAYDVNVAQAGTYSLTARMASGGAGTKTMTLQVDGATVATFNLDQNLGWQGWRSVTVPGVRLAAGSHVLRLTMVTGGFNVNYVDVSAQANQAPTANAGADRTVNVNTVVTLDGRASADPDNGPSALTYLWTQVSGPSVPLSGATTAQPAFNASSVATYVFRLVVNDGAAASAPDEVTITANSGIQYIELPGRLQAEAYRPGGANVGYRDLTAGNQGGQLRTDDVDIEATADVGGGHNVGWIDATEWLAYDVRVARTGAYALTARVASGNAGTKTFRMLVDGVQVATFSFADAAGWQAWRDVTVRNVNLTAGVHLLTLEMSTGGFNVNYVDVAAEAAGIPLPGRIQAEDYKAGGQGVGYNDATAANEGGAYRTDAVDIEATSDLGGGFNVGWTAAGEWLAYDVNVAQSGTYTLTARVAGGAAGTKTLVMSVDGANVATFSFTDASGWQAWRDVQVTGVSLAAGAHVVRLTMQTGGFNLNYLDVTTGSQPELLQNGGFSNGLTGWNTEVTGTAAAAFSVDAGAAKAAITAQGGQTWDIQITQPISLVAGKTYTLEFDVKAEATPKTFKVVAERIGGAWDKYHEQAYTVTAAANAWQRFRVTWVQPVADGGARVGFHFGTFNVSDVWVDNVSLR